MTHPLDRDEVASVECVCDVLDEIRRKRPNGSQTKWSLTRAMHHLGEAIEAAGPQEE